MADQQYGQTKLFRILQLQVTDKAALIGGGSIPYATGPCVDISGYTGWGRMIFKGWGHTGASGITGPPTGATGLLSIAPWHATYAYYRGGTPTYPTGPTGNFNVGATSALTVYDTPNGTATAFNTRGFTNTYIDEVRWFDCDASYQWVGAGVTIAGTGGPKFAFCADIELTAKVRPKTTDYQ